LVEDKCKNFPPFNKIVMDQNEKAIHIVGATYKRVATNTKGAMTKLSKGRRVARLTAIR
jgi:hypothetical protein